jgi:hypothetical protein
MNATGNGSFVKVFARSPAATVAMLLLATLLPTSDAFAEPPAWIVRPFYETASSVSSFSIVDQHGVARTLYRSSYAVLILEGAYQSRGGFPSATAAATRSDQLLRQRLEARGFHVIIWKDLGSQQLKTVLDEIFSTIGYDANARLFFYYLGHGQVIGTESDAAGSRTFLVPIDAPDPSKDELAFEHAAFPITQLIAYANQATLKHAFFALEACRAGSIFVQSLGVDPVNRKGYFLTEDILHPVRQFLTAGNNVQLVPADNSFTAVLASALSDPGASGGKDGYITGIDVINYVSRRMPQWRESYPLTPEHDAYPHGGSGDFIFGAADPGHVIPVAPAGEVVSGTIVISSNPSGARVLVDGIYRGLTPLTVPDVPAGRTILVRGELAGHSPYEEHVQLTAGQSTPLEMRLATSPDVARPPAAAAGLSAQPARRLETIESQRTLRGAYMTNGSVVTIQQKLRQSVDTDLTERCKSLGGIIRDTNFDRECDSGDMDDCTTEHTFFNHMTCQCHATAHCLIEGR